MKKIIFATMAFVMAMSFMACKKNGLKMEMVNIPDQNFKMLKTEVTQKLYENVMGENPSYFKGEKNPVEMVSWYDAIYFCNKLSLLKILNLFIQ